MEFNFEINFFLFNLSELKKKHQYFQDYYNNMPWLALNFQDRMKKQELCQEFGVGGIPTLILFDESGKVFKTRIIAQLTI